MPLILLTDDAPILLVSVSPVSADTAGGLDVEVVWQSLEPVDDPIDPDLFVISRGSLEYPLVIESLPDDKYLVRASVALTPGETVTLRAEAYTESGESEVVTWSFTTRPPFGEVQARAALPLRVPAHKAARSHFIVPHFIHARQLAEVENRGMTGHSRARGEFLLNLPPVEQIRAMLTPGFVLAGQAESGIARLTVVRPFIDPAAESSIEIGIPAVFSAESSIEIEGLHLSPAIHSMIVAFFGELERAGISHEVGRQIVSELTSSIETGQPHLSESMQSIETEEGATADGYFDLLSDVLGGARE